MRLQSPHIGNFEFMAGTRTVHIPHFVVIFLLPSTRSSFFTTLIILCSIENHHKKINSYYHTLLILSLFSHNDRLFSGLYFLLFFSFLSSFLVLNFPFIRFSKISFVKWPKKNKSTQMKCKMN